jgi:hypothetical protein
MSTKGIEVELWFFADSLIARPGYTSIQKKVVLPFVPRVGDSVILKDKSDCRVREVCIDFDDDVISIGLELTMGELDDELANWLIKKDDWTIN